MTKLCKCGSVPEPHEHLSGKELTLWMYPTFKWIRNPVTSKHEACGILQCEGQGKYMAQFKVSINSDRMAYWARGEEVYLCPECFVCEIHTSKYDENGNRIDDYESIGDDIYSKQTEQFSISNSDVDVEFNPEGFPNSGEWT